MTKYVLVLVVFLMSVLSYSNPDSTKIKKIKPKKKTEIVQERQTSKDGYCEAVTKKGNRCKRKALDGSKYCWQHNK